MDKEERIIEQQEADELASLAPPMESTALITIQQLPVIQQNLIAVKERWEQIAKDAKGMVATEETVQTLKKTKAAINDEFKDIDAQRIETKKRYMAPWDAVEQTYKDCIKNPKDAAVASLTETISGFESLIVEKTRKKLETYHAELCALERIDFLPFDKAMELAGIKRISLTDAKKREPKALKDALGAAVAKVAEGINQIQQMEDSAEVLSEYKKCFDVGTSVAIVQQRKRQKAEAEAELQRRSEETAAESAMVSKVEAILPTPVSAPTPDAEPTRTVAQPGFWKKMSFTIYFRNEEEYHKVRPALSGLKEILIREGIEYGK